MEPFPCETCGLVLADFPLLQEHVTNVHKKDYLVCKYCGSSYLGKEELQNHMIDKYEEVVLLHSMGTLITDIRERTPPSEAFEKFTDELSKLLKVVLENQNEIKQELFILRTNQDNRTNNNHVQIPAEAAWPPAPSSNGHASYGSSPPVSETPSTKPPNYVQPKTSPKILYIGDSISANVNMKALQKATEKKIVMAKAYTSVHDTIENAAKKSAKFPLFYFTDVIPTEFEKDKYEILIL